MGVISQLYDTDLTGCGLSNLKFKFVNGRTPYIRHMSLALSHFVCHFNHADIVRESRYLDCTGLKKVFCSSSIVNCTILLFYQLNCLPVSAEEMEFYEKDLNIAQTNLPLSRVEKIWKRLIIMTLQTKFWSVYWNPPVCLSVLLSIGLVSASHI